MFVVLQGFGYPSEFVDRVQELYKGVSAAVVVIGRLCPSFAVGRGIRQGCPLSPLLFVLAIDPLLRRVHSSTDIRGFPLPGQEQVKVSANADDISFLRDSGSFVAFPRLLTTYTKLSGAQINMGKSWTVRFVAVLVDLLGGVEGVEAVKALGVTFHSSGEMARETWKGLAWNPADCVK